MSPSGGSRSPTARSGLSSPLRASGRSAMDPGPSVDTEGLRAGFKLILCRKYRSVLGAWRYLDPLRQGRLSFFDFCKASTKLGGICDARVLWLALDTNKDGFVSLDEVDPE